MDSDSVAWLLGLLNIVTAVVALTPTDKDDTVLERVKNVLVKLGTSLKGGE